jgi:hypothetical protein
MPRTSSGKQISVNLDFTTEIEKVIKELENYKSPQSTIVSMPTSYNFEVGM